MGTIYDLMLSLFGMDLAEHMWGWWEPDGNFTKQNLFNLVGIMLIGTSLFFVLSFYFVINHPRFNRWYHWILLAILTFFCNLFIGFSIPYADLVNQNISPDLTFTYTNCLGFGLVNAFYSLILFIILSFIFRWWSKNCSTCPIPN